MLAALAWLVLGAPDGALYTGRSPWSVRAPIMADVAYDDTPATSRRIEAAAAFTKGEAAYQRREYERASGHFARAYELLPHPATLYNLGMAQARSGDTVAAWETFDRLVKEAPTPSERRDAVVERDRLRPSVALLHIQAAPGSSVCLDGQHVDIATNPGVVATQPGTHRLHFGDTSTRLDLRAGETHAIDVESLAALERMRRPPRAMMPLLTTTALGAGVATGLGIAAATTSARETRRGLAAGAAAASGVALGTSVAALVIRARARSKRRHDTAEPTTTECTLPRTPSQAKAAGGL